MSEATNESGKEDSTNGEHHQDSTMSFENDTESTSSQEEELEDWIEYKSAREADKNAADIQYHNWVETQKKLKWRRALRIAHTEWNPGLIMSTRTERKAGRPAKRWEDDLNEFVTEEDTEATQSNDRKNNNTWLTAARNVHEWKKERKHYAQQSIDE